MAGESRNRWFSLIEAGVVVLVLCIMAALVVPSLMRTIKERRSAEATENIRAMFQEATQYYEDQVKEAGGDNSEAHFPPSTDGPHPATVGKKPTTTADWHLIPAFKDLGFKIDEPHYYQYAFQSDGVGDNAHFTISAFGDLDGDGKKSRFQIEGYIQNGEVRGKTIIVDRLE